MILGDHRKRDKPHWADYALAAAYETIDAEKCPKCAVPIWWAYSENTAIEFEHDHVDCESCKWDEQEKKKIKQDKPGRTLFVKPIPAEGEKLPTRADFQNEMIAKAAKQAEKKVKSAEH
jgi:hypothetical protein